MTNEKRNRLNPYYSTQMNSRNEQFTMGSIGCPIVRVVSWYRVS